MKKIRKMTFIFIQIACATLFYANSVNASDYMKGCNKINKQQEQKLLLSCNSITLPGLQSQEIDRFKNKLQQVRVDVQKRHDNLFEGIKTEFDMDETKWKDTLEIIRISKECEKERQHLSLPDVVHDKTMPCTMKRMLKSFLISSGVNPKRIDFRHKTSDSFMVRSPITLWSLNGSELTLGKTHKGEICIYTPLLLKSQEALCLIMVECIKQLCDINLSVLVCLFQRYLNVTADTIHNSQSFKKYVASHFPYASFLAALQKQKTADVICAYYLSCSPTLDCIEALQYYTLCAKIKRYWDTIEWLQQYGVPAKLIMPKELIDKSETSDEDEQK